MKKKVFILTIILIISLCIGFNSVVNAGENPGSDEPVSSDGIEELISSMNGTNTPVSANGSRVGKVINTVIGLMQIVGTGISLIVITLLGIKYILASPGEKADVKKSIMPILIGCVLLFGAVNLIGLLATFSSEIFS